MASGVASLALMLEMYSLLFLIAVPIPHLVVVWRRWSRGGEIRRSRFAARRALACAVGVSALVYSVGVIRAVPENGWQGLFWPQTIGSNEVERDFEIARQMTLSFPLGQGALPIGGRSYLISAELTAMHPTAWGRGGLGYDRVDVRVPYARWVDGFDPDALDPTGDPEPPNHAAIQMFGRAQRTLREISVLCTQDRIYGLRQCFAERYEAAWLADMGIDAEDLELVSLEGEHARPDSRQVLALDDRQRGEPAPPGHAGLIDRDRFLARCDGWQSDAGDTGPPPPEARWRGNCEVFLDIGRGQARLEMDAQVLPFWQQVHAGIIADLAAWQAAAEGADRIDVVAERVAAAWAEQVEIHVTPLCQFDRVLVAAIGIEWQVAAGFQPSPPFCMHLRQGFLPGWRPRQDSNLRPRD